jgi:DNA-binding MarR family transcriptional regulator
MSNATLPTARNLLEVTMLLMRRLSAGMRRSRQHLAPAQVGLLVKLEAGPCSVSTLAQHHVVRLPTISKAIGVLEQHGWAERFVTATNRRQTMVRLTPSGRRVSRAIKRRAELEVAGILAPLSAAERADIDVALQSLGRALRQ